MHTSKWHEQACQKYHMTHNNEEKEVHANANVCLWMNDVNRRKDKGRRAESVRTEKFAHKEELMARYSDTCRVAQRMGRSMPLI